MHYMVYFQVLSLHVPNAYVDPGEPDKLMTSVGVNVTCNDNGNQEKLFEVTEEIISLKSEVSSGVSYSSRCISHNGAD